MNTPRTSPVPDYAPPVDGRAWVATVARRYHLRAADLRGPCRSRQHVRARREAARSLQVLGLSLTEIGALLNRDHTTVMNLIDPTRKQARHRKAVRAAARSRR